MSFKQCHFVDLSLLLKDEFLQCHFVDLSLLLKDEFLQCHFVDLSLFGVGQVLYSVIFLTYHYCWRMSFIQCHIIGVG